jgi:predicted transcriptional regulator
LFNEGNGSHNRYRRGCSGAEEDDQRYLIERRGQSDIPVNIVISEKEAGVSFNLIGGRSDYVGFLGADPAFVNWVKDLFVYYWENGTRV